MKVGPTSDFEYEFHMASMNRSLNPGMDTLFMMTSKDYFFVSSRTIKEVAKLGGGVEGLVPDLVARRLKKKFKLPVKGIKEYRFIYGNDNNTKNVGSAPGKDRIDRHLHTS